MTELNIPSLHQIAQTFVSCESAQNFLNQENANLCVLGGNRSHSSAGFYVCMQNSDLNNITNYFLSFLSSASKYQFSNNAPILYYRPMKTFYFNPNAAQSIPNLTAFLGKILLQSIGSIYEKREQIYSLAAQGKLSLSQLEEAIVTLEFENLKQTHRFTTQCSDAWKSEGTSLLKNNYASAGELFCYKFRNQDLWATHLDWSNKHQASYCQKHPEDSYSCEAIFSFPAKGYNDKQFFKEQTKWATLFNNNKISYSAQFAEDISESFTVLAKSKYSQKTMQG